MRSEHRAPFVASIVVVLACIGVMAHAVRTDALGGFVRIMPRDYQRVLEAQARAAAFGRDASFTELVGVAVSG